MCKDEKDAKLVAEQLLLSKITINTFDIKTINYLIPAFIEFS